MITIALLVSFLSAEISSQFGTKVPVISELRQELQKPARKLQAAYEELRRWKEQTNEIDRKIESMLRGTGTETSSIPRDIRKNFRESGSIVEKIDRLLRQQHSIALKRAKAEGKARDALDACDNAWRKIRKITAYKEDEVYARWREQFDLARDYEILKKKK